MVQETYCLKELNEELVLGSGLSYHIANQVCGIRTSCACGK